MTSSATALAARTPASASPTPIPAAPGTTSTFSFGNLRPADVVAVCEALDFPLPTPDVTLEAICAAEGMTARDVWCELAGATTIRLMIAAAALRSVTRYPDDPRLNPAPHAKAPVRKPKTTEETARSAPQRARAQRERAAAAPRPADQRLEWVTDKNPKRPGTDSYDRFALYSAGATRAELIAAGLRPADLKWDEDRGFIRWAAAPAESTGGEA